MRIISWNIRYSTTSSTHRRLEYLQSINWDLIALQEVSKKAWAALKAADIFNSGYFTLDTFGIHPPGPKKHGAAIISRNDRYKVSSPKLLPIIPKVERAISVTVIGAREPFSLVSWHSPNARGEGESFKMEGYRGFTEWLKVVDQPCIACFDGNHWNVRTELALPDPPKEGERFYEEDHFFSNNPPHELEDVFIKFLQNSPDEYMRIINDFPNGPLAVSYVRKGSGRVPIKDRFDYIFASHHFKVGQCLYDHDNAIKAGSDHGVVIVDLEL
jgi:exonuclease III